MTLTDQFKLALAKRPLIKISKKKLKHMHVKDIRNSFLGENDKSAKPTQNKLELITH